MAADQTEKHAIDEALVAEHEGIQPSKISPCFLHSNSTSHTWAFSAIAELIDNACDANALELKIEKRDIMTKDCLIDPKVCLTLLDNGKGMNHEELCNMLSFGFSMHNGKIGKYGNGFKAGSMRIGDDVMVLTRCKTSTSVGLLSQTYLKAIKAKYVIVPIVTWALENKDTIKRELSSESAANRSAILAHGLFSSEEELMNELKTFKYMKNGTGTNIIIFNLRKDKSWKTELDFSSDPTDIRNPETALNEEMPMDRPVIDVCPEYRKSLREYCSILYFKPRMKIVIRGSKVITNLIDKSLSKTEKDVYKPTWLDRPVKFTFGFTKNKDTEAYGLMLYHNNRLIDAYRKVGCQKKGKGHGIGVIGVVVADFLDPTQNKQEFINNEKYRTFMNAAAAKLNDYYYEKTNTTDPNLSESSIASSYYWAQCDNCNTWRRLPAGQTDEQLPKKWFCRQNPDVYYNRCDIPEEPEEGEEPRTTYKKTYKKAMEEKRRQEKLGEAISTNSKSIEPTKREPINQIAGDGDEDTPTTLSTSSKSTETTKREPIDQIAGDGDEDLPMAISTNSKSTEPTKREPIDQIAGDGDEPMAIRTNSKSTKPTKRAIIDQMAGDGDEDIPMTIMEATEAMLVPSIFASPTTYSKTPKRKIEQDFCSQKTKQRKNESPELPVMDIYRKVMEIAHAQFKDEDMELNVQSYTDIGKADTISRIHGAVNFNEETIQTERRTDFEKMEVQSISTGSQSNSEEKTNFLPLMTIEHGQKMLELEGSKQKLVRKITELERRQQTLLDESKEFETLKRTLLETTKELHDTQQKLVEKLNELADTKHKLCEETNKLEETTRQLAEKTNDLESTKKILHENTIALEDTKQKLDEKLNELTDTKHKLCEETNKLEETTRQLAEKTNDLESTKKILREYTIALEDTKQKLVEKLNELTDSKHKLCEETNKLEETTRQLAEKTNDLESTKKILREYTIALEDTKQKLDDKLNELTETKHKLCEETDKLEETTRTLTEKTKDVGNDLECTKQELNSKEHTLLEKTKELDETKQNLTNLRTNIWEMMKILISDIDCGEPEHIEKVIMEFIQHERGLR